MILCILLNIIEYYVVLLIDILEYNVGYNVSYNLGYNLGYNLD